MNRSVRCAVQHKVSHKEHDVLADSAQASAKLQEELGSQNSTCVYACIVQMQHDARALCNDADLLQWAVLQGLLLEQMCHSLQHSSQADAFRQLPWQWCLHACTDMFLGCLSKVARIHNYDYDCSFSSGIVISFAVILTVIAAAAAAAAAAATNMVYGCYYNQAYITGTIMTAFLIFDNFTVFITTVSVLCVHFCHRYHHHFCLSRRQGNAFQSCSK